MAQFSDFINRIFSNERTQGLSGGAETVVESDPASAFYAARLRKHRTDEDIVNAPEHIWATASYGGRKGGLRAHVQAEKGDSVANFTDVLLIINQSDARRAAVVEGEPWTERAARAIGERFSSFCEKEKFELRYASRPLRFWIVADGGTEMMGQGHGLGPGEFITGLVPNLYVGPAKRSRPVLAVHLNLPGAWEGYREVGRIYSDQMLFTLGRHWLDNFHHPALREPGLYRLQQYPDGSLVHTISPELQRRYLVRSDQVEGGASVLTIAEWGGAPVAYMVLAMVDAPAPEARAEAEVSPVEATPVEVAVVAESDADAEATAAAAKAKRREKLTRTIVPGAMDARIFTLQERGALLQKVHFANYMDGYDVYIGAGAAVATQMAQPRCVLQVRGGRVSLLVHDAKVRVNGEAAEVGALLALQGNVTIEIDGNTVEYRDLSHVTADGWPYLGELRRAGGGTYLEFETKHRIGRDRRCKVRLPDEPQNDNIVWLPSVGGGTTIRSRTGEIAKSRFYTDSIMVASEHAEIDLDGEPVLRSLARQCYTFVRRGDQVFSLVPRAEGFAGAFEVALQPDDEVLAGNCLFQVSFPPSEALRNLEPTQLSEPPPPPMSPVDLDDAADAPPPPQLDKPAASAPAAQTPAQQPGIAPGAGVVHRPRALTMDVPAAFGLGERGTAPRPVRLGDVAVSPHPGNEDHTTPVQKPASRGVPAIDERPIPDSSGAFPALARPMRAPVTAPVPAPPEPDPLPAPLPEVNASSEADLGVVSVDEAQWQFELSRPAQLLQVGWTLSGEAVVGNHRGCAIVIPEVRAFAEQAFMTLDYFRVQVRGKRGKIELLQEGDARILVNGAEAEQVEQVEGATLEVVRRDKDLEPDFDVSLSIQDEPGLPDPRARLLAVDVQDRLVAALFTTGLPLRAPRRVQLGPVTLTALYDGERLVLSDYLDSYRLPGGTFQPVFFREGARAYRTLPEDGAAVTLSAGDQLIAGNCVYRFKPA